MATLSFQGHALHCLTASPPHPTPPRRSSLRRRAAPRLDVAPRLASMPRRSSPRRRAAPRLAALPPRLASLPRRCTSLSFLCCEAFLGTFYYLNGAILGCPVMGLNICPNSKESLEGFDCKLRKDLSQMGNDVLVTAGSISQDEQRKSASSKRQEDWKGNLGQKSTEVNSTPGEVDGCEIDVLDEYQKKFGESWRTAQEDNSQPWPYLNEALQKFQACKYLFNVVYASVRGVDPAEADKLLKIQRELDETKIILGLCGFLLYRFLYPIILFINKHKTIDSVLARGRGWTV
ncbi:hypothetical protein Fmac_005797 [Flemingia macrophylla]|uniref:Uncharacterized protein n=1 Tax=Flemingia macrophylla TaxID=520843 RepID=A0ABD1N8S8_9FABA